MGKACRVKYSTRTHKKRRGFMRKKVVNDSLDVGSVSDVNIVNNNDVDTEISNASTNSVNIVNTSTASEKN